MASVLKPKSNDTVAEKGTGGPTGLAGFNLDDFAEAGIRRLKSAENEAAKILAEAREQAVRIREEAAEQGQREGFKAGMAEAETKIRNDVQQEIGKRIPSMEIAIQQIADAQEAYLNEFQQTFVTTLLCAVERVVLGKLEREPEIICRWAESAVSAAKASTKLSLVVHPETMASHGDLLERLLNAPGLPEHACLESDESLDPEGVEVRTEGGSIGLTLAQQLERLSEMLRGDEPKTSNESVEPTTEDEQEGPPQV